MDSAALVIVVGACTAVMSPALARSVVDGDTLLVGRLK